VQPTIFLFTQDISYQRDELDKEFPPMIENVVQEGVATGDILVCLQVF
jgi:hypothetical protein